MYIKVVKLDEQYLIIENYFQMHWVSFKKHLQLKQSLYKMYKINYNMYRKIFIINLVEMMPH